MITNLFFKALDNNDETWDYVYKLEVTRSEKTTRLNLYSSHGYYDSEDANTLICEKTINNNRFYDAGIFNRLAHKFSSMERLIECILLKLHKYVSLSQVQYHPLFALDFLLGTSHDEFDSFNSIKVPLNIIRLPNSSLDSAEKLYISIRRYYHPIYDDFQYRVVIRTRRGLGHKNIIIHNKIIGSNKLYIPYLLNTVFKDILGDNTITTTDNSSQEPLYNIVKFNLNELNNISVDVFINNDVKPCTEPKNED